MTPKHLRNIIATISFSTLLWSSPQVSATPIIDQKQLDISGGGLVITDFITAANGANGLDGAQTFTVGVTGYLTRIDVPIRLSGGTGDLLFDIRPVIGGIPVNADNSALSAGAINSSLIPTSNPVGTTGWTTLNLTGQGIFVTAGEQLALALRAQRNSATELDFAWFFSAVDNPYAGGSNFLRGSNAGNVPVIPSWSTPSFNPLRDRGFITYVDVREPSALFLLGGALWIACFWWRYFDH